MIALTCKKTRLHDSPPAELGLEIGTRTASVVFVNVTDTMPQQYPETSSAKVMVVDQRIRETPNSHCGKAARYKGKGIMSENIEYKSFEYKLSPVY